MSSKDKQQTEKKIVIEKNIVIDASPEVVSKAITDQEELTNWFPDQAILEPKVGGRMKFSFHKEENSECRQGSTHEGTITEFIPDKKISYTWECEPDFPRTVVTWELERIESNKTSLKLLHTGFKADEKANQYEEGCSQFLNELVKYCEKTK